MDGNKQGKGIRARFLFSILSIFFLENKPCFSKCLGMFCFLTFDLSDQLAGIAVKPVMEILVLISFAEWFGVMMYIGANWLWYPTGGGPNSKPLHELYGFAKLPTRKDVKGCVDYKNDPFTRERILLLGKKHGGTTNFCSKHPNIVGQGMHMSHSERETVGSWCGKNMFPLYKTS